jgi:hypothetical protein
MKKYFKQEFLLEKSFTTFENFKNVQSNHKWYAFELNSKFHKAYQILLKSLIN